MAGKTPGAPRKNSSKKTAAKQTKPITSISQGDSSEQAVTKVTEVGINSVERTVTPISQRNVKSAEGRKHDSVHLPSAVYEEIRVRAYQLYEERGHQHGFHQDDWARAEREILTRFEREKSA
jgi:Protein of unknown function (DUF2934)